MKWCHQRIRCCLNVGGGYRPSRHCRCLKVLWCRDCGPAVACATVRGPVAPTPVARGSHTPYTDGTHRPGVSCRPPLPCRNSPTNIQHICCFPTPSNYNQASLYLHAYVCYVCFSPATDVLHVRHQKRHGFIDGCLDKN